MMIGGVLSSLEDMCIKTWLKTASASMMYSVNNKHDEIQESLAGVLREVLGGVCSTNIRLKMMEALVDVRFLIDLCKNHSRVPSVVNKVINFNISPGKRLKLS